MSLNDRDLDGGESEGGELPPFERNRYFTGKLMTASDMLLEQKYHADRLERLSRFVIGRGIVCGLGVNKLTEEEGLKADIDPGIALDLEGRQIVVDRRYKKTVRSMGSVEEESEDDLSGPDEDEIFLYLSYDERKENLVPVPGAESAREEREQYNRIIETFDLLYREIEESDQGEDESRYKNPREIEVPENSDEFNRIARSYNEGERCSTGNGSAIFLGSFRRVSGGDWISVEDEEKKRPFVYTNDMLYAAAVEYGSRLTDLQKDMTAHEEYIVANSLQNMYWAYFNLNKEYGEDVGDTPGEFVDEIGNIIDEDGITSIEAYRDKLRSELISKQKDVINAFTFSDNRAAVLLKNAIEDLEEIGHGHQRPDPWELIRYQDWVSQAGQRVKKPN